MSVNRLRRAIGPSLLVAACWFVAGLAVARLLFEWRFPEWAALGRALPAAGLGLAFAAVGGVLWRRGGAAVVLASLPLLANLLWLLDPAVELARGRFLFAAGWWLALALGAWARLGDDAPRWRRLGPLLVAVVLLPVYLLTMSSAVGAADTFEFQVVAPQLGIAHPTGYPLYLLLGKLFSLLPLGTVAWRLNVASAVFATLAAAGVFRLALDLLGRPLPALVGAVALGLTPVFWGQAIVAEVYTLHALLVVAALSLTARLATGRGQRRTDRRKTVVALAFVIGLGLTNHLTSVFLLPPAALALFLRLWRDQRRDQRDLPVRPLMRLVPIVIAFAAPLLLYLYLPLRWRVVNGEPMGVARFVDWVVGGRFQGALQLAAWREDPARWGIVGRLLLDAWGWFLLALALVGLVWLLRRARPAALVLLLAATGFTFYALNYYVPDLAVFLIATHVIIGVFVAAGVAALMAGVEELHAKTQSAPSLETEFLGRNSVSSALSSLVFLLALLPVLTAVGSRWSAVSHAAEDGGEPWARAVLARPLAQGAAVLADSEKIAPLYYLQQIAGLRPDLDIMVLPDEAAYRAELDARLAAGQPVYLARYLPGLAGVYHLRSAGPLVEVSREPLTVLPAGVAPAERVIGPLQLRAQAFEPVAAADPSAAGLWLYWSLDRPLAAGEASPVLYLRWLADGAPAGPVVTGVHPVNDAYPVNAWRAGEIVPDFHLLPLPDVHCGTDVCEATVQVAVAPRFAPAAGLEWYTVTTMPVSRRAGPVGAPRRAFFEGFALDGVAFPAAARPGGALTVRYSGVGAGEGLTFLAAPEHAIDSLIIPTGRAPERHAAGASSAYAAAVEPAVESGPHVLIAYTTGEAGAVCGWLARPTTGCVVAELDVRGAVLPAGATNFDDRIALLDVALGTDTLAPGGQLPLTLTWQGLAEMEQDYTVFVQVLDPADRIVGQVDAWPVQGTRPTSQWTPGDVVTDPYLVQLSADLPPGDYRLHVGLYLLATLERLPVLGSDGAAVDDKVEVGGLVVR